MAEFVIRVDIPALDRLVQALAPYLAQKTAQAALGERQKPEPLPEPVPEPEAAPEPETAPETEAEPVPAPAPKPIYTLDQVQRAAAQLRDMGKLQAVTGMFGEFGIRKLSDLTDEAKLQAFAGRLQEMGAKL